jgi:membrane protein
MTDHSPGSKSKSAPAAPCSTHGRRNIWAIVKHASWEWYRHNTLQLAAALSYYTLFSLGPLLLIATAIAGALFGRDAANGELLNQIGGMVGADTASVIAKVLASTRYPSANIFVSIVGIVALLLGATGVFIELRTDLNMLWDVKATESSSGVWGIVRERLLSFSLVIAVGFLLLVSLVMSAALAAMDKYFTGFLPLPDLLMRGASVLVSFVLVSLLFALIFRVLPSVTLKWRDVALGAVITALLFNIGKIGIGLYIGRSAVASAYGASASIIVLLVWTYYSSLILFFGASLTRAVATDCGRREMNPVSRRTKSRLRPVFK